MRTKTILSLLLLFVLSFSKAQTVDEIISEYFDAIGGVEKWKTLNGFKITGKMIGQQSMEIPAEVVELKDGRKYTKISLQGKDLMQDVFDGTSLWGTNFMTSKAEKNTQEEVDNYKLTIGEFPDVFLDYKKRGLTAEFLGEETIDGAKTYKIMLTKKPIKINGKEVSDIKYYYFDAESYVPILMESEMRGGDAGEGTMQTKFSDFSEVDGLLFPFSITWGVKDTPNSSPLVISKIELNPAVDSSVFAFKE